MYYVDKLLRRAGVLRGVISRRGAAAETLRGAASPHYHACLVSMPSERRVSRISVGRLATHDAAID